jgi:hypothetical protein
MPRSNRRSISARISHGESSRFANVGTLFVRGLPPTWLSDLSRLAKLLYFNKGVTKV